MKDVMKFGLGFTLVAVAIAAVNHVFLRSEDASPKLASTRDRIQPATCFECHENIARRYEAVPHNRTLRRGDDPVSLAAFAGKTVRLGEHTVAFHDVDGELWGTHSAMPLDRRVDWVFGSGHRAMTPVSIDTDPEGHPRLMQFNVSVLSDGNLGPTPGLGLTISEDPTQIVDAQRPPTHGLVSDAAESRRCFGCHVSGLRQVDGAIDLNAMIPNIDCGRCHPGGSQHAESGGHVGLAFNWRDLSPLESINRCGECHRRVDEFTPDELDPSMTHLVRFSPVGMAMSRCFSESQLLNSAPQSERFPRFDCISCHDPHAPAVVHAAHYNQVCLTCHAFPSDKDFPPHRRSHAIAGPCTTEPAGSSCVTCHMPKVESGAGLYFTDHWIRSR